MLMLGVQICVWGSFQEKHLSSTIRLELFKGVHLLEKCLEEIIKAGSSFWTVTTERA